MVLLKRGERNKYACWCLTVLKTGQISSAK